MRLAVLLAIASTVLISAGTATALPLTYSLDDSAPLFLVDGAEVGIAAAGFVIDTDPGVNRLEALVVVASDPSIALQLVGPADLVADGLGGFQIAGASAIFLHPALDPAGEAVNLDAFLTPQGSQFTFNFFGLPTGIGGPPDVTALSFNASRGGDLPSVDPIQPVPEPRSAVAYLAGLLVVGWAIRRHGAQIERRRTC